MMYICAWQAPELAPDRLISSRITDASVTLSPPPPYSTGISAASHPASPSALTNASGYSARSSTVRQYSLPNDGAQIAYGSPVLLEVSRPWIDVGHGSSVASDAEVPNQGPRSRDR